MYRLGKITLSFILRKCGAYGLDRQGTSRPVVRDLLICDTSCSVPVPLKRLGAQNCGPICLLRVWTLPGGP